MKYHILHDLRTSPPFKEKSSDHFKVYYKLMLLTNFAVNLISSTGGVMNQTYRPVFDVVTNSNNIIGP